MIASNFFTRLAQLTFIFLTVFAFIQFVRPKTVLALCSYCSSDADGLECARCNDPDATQTNAEGTHLIGGCLVPRGTVSEDGKIRYKYDYYNCRAPTVYRNSLMICGAPYLTAFVDKVVYDKPQDTKLSGCWDPACGPNPCLGYEGGSYCGDGVCDTGEDCSSCSADCGSCPTTSPTPTLPPAPTAPSPPACSPPNSCQFVLNCPRGRRLGKSDCGLAQTCCAPSPTPTPPLVLTTTPSPTPTSLPCQVEDVCGYGRCGSDQRPQLRQSTPTRECREQGTGRYFCDRSNWLCRVAFCPFYAYFNNLSPGRLCVKEYQELVCSETAANACEYDCVFDANCVENPSNAISVPACACKINDPVSSQAPADQLDEEEVVTFSGEGVNYGAGDVAYSWSFSPDGSGNHTGRSVDITFSDDAVFTCGDQCPLYQTVGAVKEKIDVNVALATSGNNGQAQCTRTFPVYIKEPLSGRILEDKNLINDCTDDGDALFQGKSDIIVNDVTDTNDHIGGTFRTTKEYLVADDQVKITLGDLGDYKIRDAEPVKTVRGGTQQISFCVARKPFKAWFQTKNGDVHAQNKLEDKLPTDSFYLMDGKAQFEGVLTAGAGLFVGEGQIQRRNPDWQDSAYAVKMENRISYNDLRRLYHGRIEKGIQKDKWGELAAREWRISELSGQISSGDKYVILIPSGGSLRFDKDFNPNTSSDAQRVELSKKVVFVVGGNVVVEPNVNQIGALILFSGTFSTAANDPTVNDQALQVYGGVIGLEGSAFDLRRGHLINDEPGERFIFDPRYLAQFTELLGISKSTWLEVAPRD